MQTITDYKTDVLLFNDGVEIEDEAMDQIKNLANHPKIKGHIAIMPDAHAGAGATIGSVFLTQGYVIPSAIGVDIGCGMLASRISDNLENLKQGHLESIRDLVLENVPVGFAHRSIIQHVYNVPTFGELIEAAFIEDLWNPYIDVNEKNELVYKVDDYIDHFGQKFNGNDWVTSLTAKDCIDYIYILAENEFVNYLKYKICNLEEFELMLNDGDETYEVVKSWKNPLTQLGTLGGGNHFIELCKSDNHLYTLVHTGSRNFGFTTGNYFIKKANDEMCDDEVELVKQGLAYTAAFEYELMHDIAVKFAEINRICITRVVEFITRTILSEGNVEESLRKVCDIDFLNNERFDCVHNTIARWPSAEYGQHSIIARKGAICVHEPGTMKPKRGIIPGAMGRKTYLVKGKKYGCPNLTLGSASHGAGRTMSRTKAKKLINLEEHVASMRGVVCNANKTNIDENMKSYKDIEAVINAQKDNIEVFACLEPLMNIKG